MILGIYVVYDLKAECFRHPQFHQSTGQAVRAFTEASNDAQTEIGRYPQDFELWKVGEIDLSKGGINGVEPMKQLGRAIDYKVKEFKQDE